MLLQQEKHLSSAIRAAQRGDGAARNELLEYLSPGILRVGGSFLGKHLTVSDDEYSVGLSALDEAITKYDSGKGAAFQTFFEIVYKRRLLDHLRKKSRIQEIPRSQLVVSALEEDNLETESEVLEAQNRYQDEVLMRERAEEISSLSRELGRFGLSFSDLPGHSPKHKDARYTAFRIAASLVKDGELWEEFLQRGMLPVTVLAERECVNRKTVERNRKYIIAVALILGGDYPLLSQYVGGSNYG